MKTFTAQVRVADRLHGHGVGRSKKEAEQQAAEAAYQTLADELPDPEELATAADASAAGA
jgi:ribonuclease III